MQVVYNMNLWVKFFNLTIQMDATEQYIPSVLFVMTYEVVPAFASVDEILDPVVPIPIKLILDYP